MKRLVRISTRGNNGVRTAITRDRTLLIVVTNAFFTLFLVFIYTESRAGAGAQKP